MSLPANSMPLYFIVNSGRLHYYYYYYYIVVVFIVVVVVVVVVVAAAVAVAVAVAIVVLVVVTEFSSRECICSLQLYSVKCVVIT
jgi:hypothetical protein